MSSLFVLFVFGDYKEKCCPCFSLLSSRGYCTVHLFFLFTLWSETRQSLWHLSPNPFNSISQQLLYHDSQSSGSSLSAPLPFVPSFYIPFRPLCVSSEWENAGLISSERRGKSLWRLPFSRSVYMKCVGSSNSAGDICKHGWHLSGSNYHAQPTVHLF